MHLRSFFLMTLLVTTQAAHAAEGDKASAKLLDNQGKAVGTVQFQEGPRGVLLHLKAENLAPGAHGVHFHSVGDCSDHEHFKAAGGHVTSDEYVEHGLLNPKGPHKGDLPNLFAGADGTAEAEFFTPAITLGGKSRKTSLLDEDGSALMIHAQADDHKSQPIGGAGERVACGVVTAGK